MAEEEKVAAIADAGTETKTVWQQAVEQAGAEMSGIEPPPKEEAPKVEAVEEKPAAKVEEPEPKKEEKPAEAKPAAVDWSKLPPEAKAAYDAAEEKAKRYQGMVHPLQRQNNDLLQKIRRPPTPEKPGDGKTTDLTSLLESEKFKKARADFPDVFEPFIEALGVTAATQKTIETKVQSLAAERQADDVKKVEDFILSQHPDFYTDVASSPVFHAWVKTQPKPIQNAVSRNSGEAGISDPQEVVDIVAMYKTATAQAKPPSSEKASDKPPAPIDPKRQRQLDTSAAPRTTAPARVSNEPPAPGTPGHWQWALERAKKEMNAGM